MLLDDPDFVISRQSFKTAIINLIKDLKETIDIINRQIGNINRENFLKEPNRKSITIK